MRLGRGGGGTGAGSVSRPPHLSLSLLSSCVCVAVVRCVCVCVPVRVCALLGVSATFLLSPSFVKNKMYTLVSGESCPQCALISLSSLTESLSRGLFSLSAHGPRPRRAAPAAGAASWAHPCGDLFLHHTQRSPIPKFHTVLHTGHVCACSGQKRHPRSFKRRGMTGPSMEQRGAIVQHCSCSRQAPCPLRVLVVVRRFFVSGRR